MAEITTTQAFSDGDTVTATKLNNITANASIGLEAITNRSAETTTDQANDLLLMYDASATALKKVTLSNVIKAGTASNFPVSGSIELGHASDTTLSRGSAGRLQVEGVDVVTATSTDTLTNKTLTSPAINTGAISGGTINNASVGATTPSTGAFTTLSASGDVAVADKIIHSGDTNTAIRFPAADTVTVETSGTERVRVDSSGNVGIGTTSPQTILNGFSSSARGIAIQNAYPIISFSDTSNSDFKLFVGTDSGEGYFWNNANGPVRFATNSTERLRITSGGEVYIAGTTDQGAYNLQVNGTGVWGAGAYVNGSDERLKENIQDITSGLDVVEKLRPVSFQYKEEYTADRSVQSGFIAQDLLVALEGKNYLEGVVSQGPTYYNVAYQNLIPILAKAIQELKAENDILKTRIAALEAA